MCLPSLIANWAAATQNLFPSFFSLCSLSFSRLLLGNDVVIVRHLRHPREQHLEVCEHVLERCRPSLVAVEAVVDGQAVDLVVLAAEREKADEGGE